MSTSMLLGLFDWIGDFFKAMFALIPKTIYLFYASLACILDVFQLAFRKLAGLDVYYDAQGRAISGDIVTNFIAGIFGIEINPSQGAHFDYSPLSTVFWSFVLFGVIICVVATFVAIIKSHYSYDDKAAKGPMQYVYTALKSVVNIFAVPLIVLLGLYVSQALLTALDSLTSTSNGTVAALFGEQTALLQDVNTSKNINPETGQGIAANDKTYIYYDIFGSSAFISYGNRGPMENFTWPQYDLALTGATTQTFSGSLFVTAAYNANRVRAGYIDLGDTTVSGLGQGELFSGAKDKDELARMIDTAFACHLHLKEPMYMSFRDPVGDYESTVYFTNYLSRNVASFSKFNVGAVWYYYDLWSFNFIVGFGSIIITATLFINLILGLISRIFMCLGLFLISPPLFGLAPLDGGEIAKKWRTNFMKQVLMVYGAVVGMNVFFIILPLMNQIYFFNIEIGDYLMQTLIIITGLITIKAFIAVISEIIGAADANKTGADTAKDIGAAAGTGLLVAGGAAKVLGGAAKLGVKTAGRVGRLAGSAVNAMSGGKLADAWAHRGKLGHAKRDEENAQKAYDQQERKVQQAQENLEAAIGTSGESAARAALATERATLRARRSALDTASDRVGGLKARKERRQAVVKAAGNLTLGTARDAFGLGMQAFEYAAKPFYDNDLVKSFLDKSKIKEAPDYPKNTSANTEKMLKQNKDILDKLSRIEKNTKKGS